MEEAIPEGLMVLALPEGQRRFLRTSNGLEEKRGVCSERVNKELRCLSKTAGAVCAPSG